MFCPRCGSANDDSARFCASCGQDLSAYRQQPAAQAPAPQQPPQYQPYQPPYQPPVQQVTVYQQPNQSGPYGGYPGGMMPNVASHMVWAIVSLIFFFWPTAIPAIVQASRVNSRLAMGDFYGAQAASRSAKMWCWVSFGIALVVWIVVAVVWVVAWRAANGIIH